MNLPKAELDRDKAMELWKTTHSDYAKEQVVLSNQGLVASVLKSMGLNIFDEDLFATGLLGLVKAINKFDPDRVFEFSTLAIPTIKNEILQLFRKKRVDVAFSLDETFDTSDGKQTSYGEKFPDRIDMEESVSIKLDIENIISRLDERDRAVFNLAFKEDKTQMEIAEIVGISQSQVSRTLSKISKKFRKEMEEWKSGRNHADLP